MKSYFIRLLVSSIFVLGFAQFGSAQSESEQISLEEIRRLCTQWAEEDGLEGDEIPEYIESCIRDEMESIGIEPTGSSGASGS